MSLETIGENAATTVYTTVTAGTANVKGNYAELSAATAIDAYGFILCFEHTTGNRNFLIDVALGAAGAEVVLLSNFFCSTGAFVTWVFSPFIPMSIPAGSRVAVRCQCNVNAQAMRCGMTLIQTDFGAYSGAYSAVETWGADTSDSAGTAVVSGQNDAKGAYAQLVASSANNTSAIIIHVGAGDFTHAANNEMLIDIATGGAGAETVLIPNIYVIGDVFEDIFRPQLIGPIPCSIPSGTRVAVRAQDTDTTVEAFDVTITAFKV